MTLTQIKKAVKTLPENELKELQDLISKLHEEKEKEKPKRGGYGSLKGKIWMSDDFDAPLDDFKEYM